MNHEVTPSQLLVETISPFKNKLLGLVEHKQRLKLHNELHTGAIELLETPTQVSHLVLLSGSDQHDHERSLIAHLCERYGVTPPTLYSNHFSSMLGTFRVKWERHTEYSTNTFFHHAPFEKPFAEPAINHVPGEWLSKLPGEIVAATHIALDSRERPQRS